MVIDPEIPPNDARLLRDGRRVLLKMRAGWVPRPRASSSGRRVRRAVAASAAVFLCVLLGFGALRIGVSLLLLLVLGLPLLMVVFTRDDLSEDEVTEYERGLYERLRWYEGRYVLPDDLDESAARLLERAQRAIASVTGSRVNAEGLLDDVRNGVMLPAQEWEIARLLAKLSALRTKHRETVSKGLTPEVEAVAEPLARALDDSEAAVLARVEALERYAANVGEAERAYLAHQQIEELRGRMHQYEELVAETGAGGLAVPEIERLAQDADRLEQALRRSISSAREAFRSLDPGTAEPDPGSPEPAPGSRESDPGSRESDPGSRESDPGSSEAP
ncbi:hypothetical protein AB0K67_05170 [Nonomuraea sp. NPDC052634]|uniref:hypothetical protein n=1 Tax=Nonomuraea sp. NPDC052634 TaxID=3155813 RepID=UPI00341B1994